MNKKYAFLPEGIELMEILKEKSIAEYCKEISAETGIDYRTLHSCITWKVNRYFTKDQKKDVKKDKNKRSRAAILEDQMKENVN